MAAGPTGRMASMGGKICNCEKMFHYADFVSAEKAWLACEKPGGSLCFAGIGRQIFE